MEKLSMYTVVSVERKTGRIVEANIMAVSVEDALRFECLWFGEPFFRVLLAYPKHNDNTETI